MYKVDLCPGSSHYVPINQISNYLVSAIIVSEDASFYQHNGFDWEELKLSLASNMRTGQYKRGGSTITQQLAKNVFLSGEKSLLRKVREAIIAFRIETHFSKKEILERYLNVVEFGTNIYGIKAAAQHYFSKPPSSLNVLESAYLAYLLPNPKKYSAVYRKGNLTPFAKSRISSITKLLHRVGKIDEHQYAYAMGQIDLFPWKSVDDFAAPPPALWNSSVDENFAPAEIVHEVSEEDLQNSAEIVPEPEPESDPNTESNSEPSDFE